MSQRFSSPHLSTDLITDLDFSPFDDFLLATGSADQMVSEAVTPQGGLSLQYALFLLVPHLSGQLTLPTLPRSPRPLCAWALPSGVFVEE